MTAVTVAARDGTLVLAHAVWSQVPVITGCVEDLGEMDGHPIPIPGASVATLRWLQQFVEACDTPAWWDANQSPQEVSDGWSVDPAVHEHMATSVPDPAAVLPMLSELNYLGGGYAYLCLCAHACHLIKHECEGDPARVQQHFKLEPLPATEAL